LLNAFSTASSTLIIIHDDAAYIGCKSFMHEMSESSNLK
jgi:hypothetical protein